MRRTPIVLLTCLAAAGAIPLNNARATVLAVLTNPATVTGSNAIDPSGSQTVDGTTTASGSYVLTPAETLEARSDFRAIHVFTNNGGSIITQSSGIGTTNTEVIYFTSATMPSIQISASGNVGASIGADMAYNQRTTSDISAIELQGASTAAYSLTLSFGSYNSTTSTFTDKVNSVAAAGFTISNAGTGTMISVAFKDASGNTLSLQTATGVTDDGTNGDVTTGSSAGADFYFGYQTPDNSYTISTVTITVSGSAISLGLDDLGFTTIPVPEPLSASFLYLGGAAAFLLRKSNK